MINDIAIQENLSMMTILESGVHGKKKPHIPQKYDKQQYNNIKEEERNKH